MQWASAVMGEVLTWRDLHVNIFYRRLILTLMLFSQPSYSSKLGLLKIRAIRAWIIPLQLLPIDLYAIYF